MSRSARAVAHAETERVYAEHYGAPANDCGEPAARQPLTCSDFSEVTETLARHDGTRQFICFCACGWSPRRFFPTSDAAQDALDRHLGSGQ